MAIGIVQYCNIHDDGGDGAFVVIAKVNDRWFHHEGPEGFSHFTYDQAERLADRIRVAGVIDMRHWEPSFATDAEIEDRWQIDAMERR